MTARRGEAGFSLVAIVAGIAVMLILMTVAVPSWRYVMQDAREEELIFRGGQIADAVARYQKKNGNASPISLEVLVKGRFLRKAYKDPMAANGQWRFLRAGEVSNAPGSAVPGAGAPGATPSASPGPDANQASPAPTSAFGFNGQPQNGGGLPGLGTGSAGAGDPGIGGFVGVASRSTDKSFRLLNGRSRYSEWLFIAGQPRIVGALPAGPVPGSAPGGNGGRQEPSGRPMQPVPPIGR